MRSVLVVVLALTLNFNALGQLLIPDSSRNSIDVARLTVLVDRQDRIHVGEEIQPLDSVQSKVYSMIIVNNDSMAVTLIAERATSYSVYVDTFEAIRAAYKQRRNELAMEQFGLPFIELDREKKQLIRRACPFLISESSQ